VERNRQDCLAAERVSLDNADALIEGARHAVLAAFAVDVLFVMLNLAHSGEASLFGFSFYLSLFSQFLHCDVTPIRECRRHKKFAIRTGAVLCFQRLTSVSNIPDWRLESCDLRLAVLSLPLVLLLCSSS
jgi:hypothetical protein